MYTFTRNRSLGFYRLLVFSPLISLHYVFPHSLPLINAQGASSILKHAHNPRPSMQTKIPITCYSMDAVFLFFRCGLCICARVQNLQTLPIRTRSFSLNRCLPIVCAWCELRTSITPSFRNDGWSGSRFEQRWISISTQLPETTGNES